MERKIDGEKSEEVQSDKAIDGQSDGANVDKSVY